MLGTTGLSEWCKLSARQLCQGHEAVNTLLTCGKLVEGWPVSRRDLKIGGLQSLRDCVAAVWGPVPEIVS
jgi:hypothetical protein